MRKCITSLQVVLPVEGCKDFWRDGHITAVRDFSGQLLQPLYVQNKLGHMEAVGRFNFVQRNPENSTQTQSFHSYSLTCS